MVKAALALSALALGGATAHRTEFQPQRANAFTVLSTTSALQVRYGSVEDALNSLDGEFELVNKYTSKHNGVEHLYVQQLVNGIPVQNGLAQVNSKNGKLLSFSNTFFKGEAPALPMLKGVKVSGEEAAARCLEFLEAPPSGCASEVKPALRYVATDDGALTLAYRIECDLTENWMESYVSAETGEIVAQIDYFHNADGGDSAAAAAATSGTYSVFTLPDVDPGLANNIPQVVSLPHTEAWPEEASTLGWHDQGEGRTFTDTRGNNVYAQENLNGGSSWESNYRPDGGASLLFNISYDFTKEPSDAGNVDSSIQNLFYLNNLQHDIFYGYGFDEVAGNFQENNLGRGGRENDAVQANAQDGSGTNNANFATPADGSRPRMRMYIWNGFTPSRDGDLEAGIVFHEYGHGISNRLTGGPSNSGCLSGVEGGAGMGEGWSDFFGKIIALKEGDAATDTFAMGDWIAGAGGIRNYPYSKDMAVNPLTFDSMNSNPYGNAVHAAGTVWCTVLWDAMWDMVAVHGWDSDIRGCGTGGNNKMLQLVVDGLKLQPCRPTMIEARDAIILADEINNGAENACTLWGAFARRGFGVGASPPSGFFGRYDASYETPASCATATALA